MKEFNQIPEKKQAKKIDILEQLRFYASKWRYILASVIVFMLIGAAYAYMKSPVYEVQANVLITDNDTKSDFLRSFSMADMFGTKSSVHEEMAIMYSHTLFMDIVKEFQLNKVYIVKKNPLKKIVKYEDSPVEIITSPTLSDTLSKPLIFKLSVNKEGKIDAKLKLTRFSTIAKVKDKTFPLTFDTPYGEFVFNKTDFYEDGKPLNITILVNSYNQATEDLQKKVMCSITNKKADVITVSLNSTSIPFAEKIVNAVVDGYNERGILENRVRNQITADFINKRLVDVASELEATEMDVEKYKYENNLTDILADVQYIFTKKGTIDEELVKAETETEILEMTRDMMNDPENRYNLIPTPVGSEAAVEAIAKYNELILERMKLVNNAKSSNNAALRAISEQLDAMRVNINETLDRSLATARVKLKDLREQMKESDSRLGQLPRQEREYLKIKRQQVVQENIYVLLLQQREQTNLRIANAIPKGQIIDKAYPLEGQVNMSKMQILMLFFILGLLPVPVWYYLKSRFCDKFSTKAELAKLTSLPILGEISKDKSGNKLVMSEHGETSEMFNLLRTNLQFMLPEGKNKVILVTSTKAGAGKTFVSVNLAACLARNGGKVLLAGMDIRNPQIKNYLDIQSRTGLAEYIVNPGIMLSELIVHNTGLTGVDVITAGAIPPNPAELLASPRVEQLVDELRMEYDYIIIDSAPLGAISDTLSLTRVSDVIAIVCRAGYTTFSEVESVNDMVSDGQIRRVGLILNGTKAPKGYHA